VEEFITSPHGRDLADPDGRRIIDNLVWYRTDYGFGDPLRWSPTAIEILLMDWFPRKVVADRAYLGRMPDALRAFIQFAHEKSDLPAELTAEALDAVDESEPAYQSIIRSPRRQGPVALLERAGLIPPLDRTDGDLPVDVFGLVGYPELHRISRDRMAEAVGGEEVLAQLDDQPLPDEEFEWSGVPEAINDGVTAVLTLADTACVELFDLEHRTAVRRLLHDVAVIAPNAFRRGNPKTAAAAACWLIGRANETLGEREDEVAVAELMDHFGLSATRQPGSTRCGRRSAPTR
jgi:hypothetical protein